MRRARTPRVWSTADDARCRAHPDLVAVYESPRRRIALLTRHTLLPLAAEREMWLRQVRGTATAVIADVFPDTPAPVVVLQLRPLREVASVARQWFCRYCADAARRDRLVDAAERQLEDFRYIIARDHAQRSATGAGIDEAPTLEERVTRWYETMLPTWLVLEPPRRRRLVLCVHRWLANRAFVAGLPGTVAELGPGAALARELHALVPASESAQWNPWIDTALAELRVAFASPAAKRREAWYREVFMIPVRVPIVPPRMSSSVGARLAMGGFEPPPAASPLAPSSWPR